MSASDYTPQNTLNIVKRIALPRGRPPEGSYIDHIASWLTKSGSRVLCVNEHTLTFRGKLWRGIASVISGKMTLLNEPAKPTLVVEFYWPRVCMYLPWPVYLMSIYGVITRKSDVGFWMLMLVSWSFFVLLGGGLFRSVFLHGLREHLGGLGESSLESGPSKGRWPKSNDDRPQGEAKGVRL